MRARIGKDEVAMREKLCEKRNLNYEEFSAVEYIFDILLRLEAIEKQIKLINK